MNKQYETVFIANPVLSAVQIKEAVGKYRDFIVAQGGEVIHEEDWGLRKLAYPIQKKSTGFYHLLEFTVAPEFINKLEIEFRRDERIMRFLTVSLDKYAVEYNEKKRAKKEQAKVENKEE